MQVVWDSHLNIQTFYLVAPAILQKRLEVRHNHICYNYIFLGGKLIRIFPDLVSRSLKRRLGGRFKSNPKFIKFPTFFLPPPPFMYIRYNVESIVQAQDSDTEQCTKYCTNSGFRQLLPPVRTVCWNIHCRKSWRNNSFPSDISELFHEDIITNISEKCSP